MNAKSALFNHVLLIEDDAGHAMIIERALREHAGRISTCANFLAAKDKLRNERADLIITDLNLPDSKEGKHIGALQTLSHETPMIVLTASTSLHEAVEAMKQGARDFLVKSFDRDFKEIFGFALMRLAVAVGLEHERRKLQAEMELLRTAIEQGQDGMAIVTQSTSIAYSNEAFRRFVQKCGGDVATLATLFSNQVSRHQELTESIRAHIRELASGSTWQTEVTFPNQRENAFNLSLTTVGSAAQASALDAVAVLWVRDISEQKRREKFQREMLSTTTHDLKGPLGAILLSSELVREEVIDRPKVSELVLRMASSAQGALNLIEEFLSARRIQEGSFVLKPQTLDLVALASESAEQFQSIAQSRGVTLELRTEEKHIAASADRLGMVRVLGNLISNALKFTPKGGQVTLIVTRVGEEARLLVRDTGSGIDPSEIKGIFERFSRLERHQQVAGSGLGLFVVKSIVAAHGGRIEVTSKVGEGSSFAVALPTQPPVNERGELICLDFA